MKEFAMRAEDIKLEELVDFADGVIDLQGRRLVIHSIDAFAQLRKDLMEMLGAEQTRRIFTRFGYFWGHADAAAMKRVLQWDSLREWILAGPRMHTMQGVARAEVANLELDESAGAFRMDVVWHDSGEAQEHLIEIGRADQPVCWMLVGYASGYASFCMGKDVYFIENKCRAQGCQTCTATGRDKDAWGDELKPHLAYFRADDIQGKVLRLTRELRSKTKQLIRQRKRLDLIQRAAPVGLVEVRSESFRRVLDLAERVARFDTSLLVTGESGTGKEVLARYIHARSRRSSGPFLPVNCGALPETLLESELFGHKAGAFTGATDDRPGVFEAAAKGTIFLDEIGDISPTVQVKLLRVLQEKEVTRLGENRPRKADVRIIAATNRDLKTAVSNASFREDLYYRLSVIEIDVPPLRERRDDILPLARHFVERLSQRLGIPGLHLHVTCLDRLQTYHWPGNVRELENALERAAVLSTDGTVRAEDLPPSVLQSGVQSAGAGIGAPRTLAELERDHILAVLRLTDGNRTRAANILGISASTLWRKLKGYDRQV